MERTTYQLRIDVDEMNYEQVSSILGLNPLDYNYGWAYEVVLEEEPEHYNVIDKFLSKLHGKYEMLEALGIQREDITIWLIYGYNNQCNMEFTPKTLKYLGENGVSLCISCYEAGYEEK